MGTLVGLVRTPDSKEGIRDSLTQALALIKFRPDGEIKSVCIKPNLCYYWNAATGYTTDPRVVSAIVDWLRERYGPSTHIRVVEADATAMRAKHAFSMLDYEKLAKEKDVELLNLSEDTLLERKVEVNHNELTFQVPQSLLTTNLFINVPKLKVMRATKITCAYKNIFGCIGTPRKIVYHPRLEEAIVGINKILRPHLTVVDGIVALGRHPVKLGLIMVATDSFAIDLVGSRIMGFDPHRIRYMRIAAKEKLGAFDGVSIVGQDPESFRKIFPRVGVFYAKLWNLQLKLLKAYHDLTGDVVPPVLDEVR
jgi:uncharacterized protein (DUF362 family)